jgi:16S rRNA (guanine527-N7)-methyltransferase
MHAPAALDSGSDMDEHAIVGLILRTTETAGIGLEDHQARCCARHLRLLLQWNRHINLTRITDPHAMVIGHLLDSLLPGGILPERGPALDIGSGAGFPGIPLKVIKPDLQMTLLEATRKKVSFLRVLLADLALAQISAVQGRWEDLSTRSLPLQSSPNPLSIRGLSPIPHKPPTTADQFRDSRFSLITMRALSLCPQHLTRLADTLLRPGGIFAWWAGPKAIHPDSVFEDQLAGTSMRFAGSHCYVLPTMARERHILLWTRAA